MGSKDQIEPKRLDEAYLNEWLEMVADPDHLQLGAEYPDYLIRNAPTIAAHLLALKNENAAHLDTIDAWQKKCEAANVKIGELEAEVNFLIDKTQQPPAPKPSRVFTLTDERGTIRYLTLDLIAGLEDQISYRDATTHVHFAIVGTHADYGPTWCGMTAEEWAELEPAWKAYKESEATR
jgi:hypothetical protein